MPVALDLIGEQRTALFNEGNRHIASAGDALGDLSDINVGALKLLTHLLANATRHGSAGFLNLGQSQLKGQHGTHHGVIVTLSNGSLAHERVF